MLEKNWLDQALNLRPHSRRHYSQSATVDNQHWALLTMTWSLSMWQIQCPGPVLKKSQISFLKPCWEILYRTVTCKCKTKSVSCIYTSCGFSMFRIQYQLVVHVLMYMFCKFGHISKSQYCTSCCMWSCKNSIWLLSAPHWAIIFVIVTKTWFLSESSIQCRLSRKSLMWCPCKCVYVVDCI